MRAWLIEKLGGYPDLDTAIEAIRYTEDARRKREILTLAVKRLFSTIGPDDILREGPGGAWLFEGRPLSKAEVQGLREEAKLMQSLRIWKFLKADLAYHSQAKVWKEAQDITDLVAGKLLSFYADIVETRLKKMNPE